MTKKQEKKRIDKLYKEAILKDTSITAHLIAAKKGWGKLEVSIGEIKIK